MKQANHTAAMSNIMNDAILGQTIACSFILVGQLSPALIFPTYQQFSTVQLLTLCTQATP